MTALGDRIARALAPDFRIERTLDTGGMGYVFVAHDVTLDRRVAIKVLRPELANERAVERFLREARILAALRHPHIVAIHRAGEADGLPFYAMDFIDGDTLAQRMAQGPVPPSEVARIAGALLEALSAVHRAGIVHRDVKPANIFLTDDQVLLADFGIARDESGQAVGGTTTAHLAGTPAYMAPEQAVGGRVGPRADLYALGMIVYEMLTGRHWPRLDEPGQAQWKDVPPRLRPVIERALAWSPEARWASAAEFHEAFQRALARTPELKASVRTAAVGGTHDLLRSPARRGLAAAILVLVLVGAYWAYGMSANLVRPSDAPSIAVLPFAAPEGDPETHTFGQGQASALINAFRRTPELYVSGFFDVLDVPPSEDDAGLGENMRSLRVTYAIAGKINRRADTLSVAVFMVASDVSRLWERSFAFPVDDLSAMYAMQDSIVALTLRELRLAPGAAMPVRRLTEDARALDAYTRGMVDMERRDPRLLRSALGLFRSAIDIDPSFAHALAALADVYSLMGSFEYGLAPPWEAFVVASEYADSALALEPGLANALASRGNIAMTYDWDFPQARAHFNAAIQDNPSNTSARQWYALLLAYDSLFDAAMEQLLSAQRVDPNDPLILTNIGRVHFLQRQYEEADEYLRQAIALDPDYAIAHTARGMNFVMRAVTDSSASVSSPYYREAIREYDELGRLLRAPGGQTQAQQVGSTAREGNGSSGAPAPDDRPIVLALKAHAFGLMGDTIQAEVLLSRLEAAELADPFGSAYVPAEYFALAHIGMGDYERAIERLAKMIDNKSGGANLLYVEPLLDPLRGRADFEAILASYRAGAIR